MSAAEQATAPAATKTTEPASTSSQEAKPETPAQAPACRSNCCSTEATDVQQTQAPLLILKPDAPNSTFDMSNFSEMVADLPDAPPVQIPTFKVGRRIIGEDEYRNR